MRITQRLFAFAAALFFPVLLAGSGAAAPPDRGAGLIVFASKRVENQRPQLYSITPAGKSRRHLGHTTEWTTCPVASPDGSHVAYSTDAGIYVARADGRDRRRIGWGEAVAWAPDSRRLAFDDRRLTDFGESSVFVADVITGLRRQLARGFHPSWSPDGRRIALSQVRDPDRPPLLTIVSASDGSVTRLLDVEGQATWAPRGDRIAVANGPGLRIIRDDGRTLSRPTVSLDSDPAWSRDGGRLALVVQPNDRVMVLRPDGSHRRVVGRTGLDEESRADCGSPAWSPGGGSLAFAGRSDVLVVRVDGTGVHRVTHEPRRTTMESAPAWARTGRIFYSARFAFNDYDLYTMRSDGSAVRRLTQSAANEGAPAWSPDGRQIAFSRGGRLFLVDRLGGRARRIPVRGVARQGSPSWSPDGSELAFVGWAAKAELPTGIYIVRSSGGSARLLRRSGPFPNSVVEPRWSSDGALLAFVQWRTLFVVRPDGRDLRKVAEAPAGDGGCGGGYRLDEPAWVPGGKLAFVESLWCFHEPYGPYDPTIEIVRLDGTRDQRLAASSSGRVAWSPDGRWIVQSGEYGDPGTPGEELDGEIVRMRSDGSDRVVLSAGATGIDPDWQPVCSRLGTGRGERLAGGRGDELLCGLGGNDTIIGGPGRDRLFGAAGDDRLLARDGEFDIVGCGPGRDSVVADNSDLVGRDCERISRGSAATRTTARLTRSGSSAGRVLVTRRSTPGAANTLRGGERP